MSLCGGNGGDRSEEETDEGGKQDTGYRFQVSGFEVRGSGFRVQVSGALLHVGPPLPGGESQRKLLR